MGCIAESAALALLAACRRAGAEAQSVESEVCARGSDLAQDATVDCEYDRADHHQEIAVVSQQNGHNSGAVVALERRISHANAGRFRRLITSVNESAFDP